MNYNALALAAKRLLTEFGQTVTLTRTSGESINPITGAVTPGSDTAYTPKAVVKNYSNNDIDGTRIKAEDRLLVMDDTVEPITDDVVAFGSVTYQVVSVKVADPAGTPLVYFAQVRS